MGSLTLDYICCSLAICREILPGSFWRGRCLLSFPVGWPTHLHQTAFIGAVYWPSCERTQLAHCAIWQSGGIISKFNQTLVRERMNTNVPPPICISKYPLLHFLQSKQLYHIFWLSFCSQNSRFVTGTDWWRVRNVGNVEEHAAGLNTPPPVVTLSLASVLSNNTNTNIPKQHIHQNSTLYNKVPIVHHLLSSH